MEISFHNNTLLTALTISGNKSQDFIAIIDTGSDRTSIPRKYCRDLGLAYSGDERTLAPDGFVVRHLFDANIRVKDRLFSLPIAGIDSDRLFILGLDILSKYKLFVDWISKPKFAWARL